MTDDVTIRPQKGNLLVLFPEYVFTPIALAITLIRRRLLISLSPTISIESLPNFVSLYKISSHHLQCNHPAKILLKNMM